MLTNLLFGPLASGFLIFNSFYIYIHYLLKFLSSRRTKFSAVSQTVTTHLTKGKKNHHSSEFDFQFLLFRLLFPISSIFSLASGCSFVVGWFRPTSVDWITQRFELFIIIYDFILYFDFLISFSFLCMEI